MDIAKTTFMRLMALRVDEHSFFHGPTLKEVVEEKAHHSVCVNGDLDYFRFRLGPGSYRTFTVNHNTNNPKVTRVW